MSSGGFVAVSAYRREDCRLLPSLSTTLRCCPFCCPSSPKQPQTTPRNDQQCHIFTNNIRRAGQITNRLLYQLSYVGIHCDFTGLFADRANSSVADSCTGSEGHYVAEPAANSRFLAVRSVSSAASVLKGFALWLALS